MMQFSDTEAFVAYRLPGEHGYELSVIAESLLVENKSLPEDIDFVFFAFDKSQGPNYAFRFDQTYENVPFCIKSQIELKRTTIRKSDYLNTHHQLSQAITDGELDKMVLSRIKSMPTEGSSAYDIFIQLLDTHPNAFVYLISHPDIGIWIGATPESLLSQKDDEIRTVALAGTKVNQLSSEIEWTQKEIDEHRYVELYFEECFNKHNISYSKSDVKTVTAGYVSHLKSEFRFRYGNLGELIDILHPSPAIAGYPRQNAIELISKIENHDRRYYCGVIGLIGKERKDLFVNLRCMELSTNQAYIYLGGGITSDSNPDSEWMETELKAKSLVSALSKKSLV